MAELPAPEMQAPETIAAVALNADKLISYVKACKAVALQRAIAGTPLPGTKLVPGPTARRRWQKDCEEGAVEDFVRLGLDPKDIVTMKLKGVVTLEKALAKEVGKEEAQNALEPYVTRTMTNPLVVSSSDPRLALPNAKDLLIDMSDLNVEEE